MKMPALTSEPLGHRKVGSRGKFTTMAAALKTREIQINTSDYHQALRKTRTNQSRSSRLQDQDPGRNE